MDIASKLAQYLLEIKAVKLRPTDPFTWSSGWKSPIYCDNRITLSNPEIRSFIARSMAERIRSEYPEANALCGVATAGIAIGALVSNELNLPYAYCRPKPKEHGMKNQLEGSLKNDDKIVVVEDLISTGGSSLKVVEYLRNEGFNVVGMASIFTYGFDIATDNFQEAQCPIFSLTSYTEMLPQAIETGYVQGSALPTLEAWRLDPANWSK